MDQGGLLLAGLGLFFAGIHMLTAHLKRLTGRRFRRAVVRWTRTPALGFVWGALAGSVIQSAAAATFVLVSLLKSGLIQVSYTIPILIGVNIGTSALVFLASFDLRLLVLYLIGGTGVLISGERGPRVETLAGAGFGIGLVFLGLQLVQDGVGPLAEAPWAQALLAAQGDSLLLAFAIGALLSLISQSSAAISIIAITLHTAGVLGFEHAISVIYASNVGSAGAVLLLSTGLRGTSRQISLLQMAMDIGSGVVLFALLVLEVRTGLPMVVAVVTTVFDAVPQQLAGFFLVTNLVPAVLLAFPKSVAAALERLSPPTPEEQEARLEYLQDHALADPETALDLVEREQARLVEQLPRYLESVHDAQAGRATRRGLSNAFRSVSREIHGFLTDLIESHLSPDTCERVNAIVSCHRLLDSMEETLCELGDLIEDNRGAPRLFALGTSIVEGLGLLLLTLEASLSRAARATTTCSCA